MENSSTPARVIKRNPNMQARAYGTTKKQACQEGVALLEQAGYTVEVYPGVGVRERASEIAGASVRLPYFFLGPKPKKGQPWPKHRCGGIRFIKGLLSGAATPAPDEAPPEKKASRPAVGRVEPAPIDEDERSRATLRKVQKQNREQAAQLTECEAVISGAGLRADAAQQQADKAEAETHRLVGELNETLSNLANKAEESNAWKYRAEVAERANQKMIANAKKNAENVSHIISRLEVAERIIKADVLSGRQVTWLRHEIGSALHIADETAHFHRMTERLFNRGRRRPLRARGRRNDGLEVRRYRRQDGPRRGSGGRDAQRRADSLGGSTARAGCEPGVSDRRMGGGRPCREEGPAYYLPRNDGERPGTRDTAGVLRRDGSGPDGDS